MECAATLSLTWNRFVASEAFQDICLDHELYYLMAEINLWGKPLVAQWSVRLLRTLCISLILLGWNVCYVLSDYLREEVKDFADLISSTSSTVQESPE